MQKKKIQLEILNKFPKSEWECKVLEGFKHVYPGLHPLEGFCSRDSQGRLRTGLRTLVIQTRAGEETGVTAEILPDLTVSFQRNKSPNMQGKGNKRVDWGPWGRGGTLQCYPWRRSKKTWDCFSPKTQVHKDCLNLRFNKNIRQHLLSSLLHLHHPIKCQIKLKWSTARRAGETDKFSVSCTKGTILSQVGRPKAKQEASFRASPSCPD